MPRIALGIEYDGSGFHGWQTQEPGVRTVQSLLEAAIGRVADQPIQIQAAGRTDTGVHATGQVAHFDTQAERSERAWVLGGNANLPPDIAITWARPVAADFHARFEATSRAYRYVILNRATRSSLWRQRAVWVHAPLDAARMHAAARRLLGEHDFSAYRAVGCQAKHPVRTLEAISVQREGDFITLDVQANAFLQHMVRNIAGVLMAIGRGDRAPDWAGEVLAGRDRTRGGVTAPPEGLYLTRVQYPPHYGLPREAAAHRPTDWP